MYKHVLLLVLSLTTVTTILAQTDEKDCFACVESEDIKCKHGATEDAIAKFISDENCQYQLYMDKLQQLDCIVKENLDVPENEIEWLWQKEMMEIRDNFYNTSAVLEEKICNDCTTNNTFDKYVRCIEDYWATMKEKAETEIAKKTNPATPELYVKCKLLGLKHQHFCTNIETQIFYST